MILNSESGSAVRRAEMAREFAAARDWTVLESTPQQPIRALARTAVNEHFDRIVVGGGDGTLSEAVNGVAPDFGNVEFAVVPMGTGNDLARSIGLSIDDVGDSLEAAAGRNVASVDLLRITNGSTSYCLNAATGGFGGNVSKDVDQHDKARWGPFAYWMTAATKLADLDAFTVQLQINDGELTLNTYGLAVCNGRFVGGGFPIAPHAFLDDGLMDITTIPVLPTLELLAAGLNFTLGRNHRDDRVQTFSARSVSIRTKPQMPFSVDGEPFNTFEAKFEVLPQAIRLVIGERPTGLAAGQTSAVTSSLLS